MSLQDAGERRYVTTTEAWRQERRRAWDAYCERCLVTPEEARCWLRFEGGQDIEAIATAEGGPYREAPPVTELKRRSRWWHGLRKRRERYAEAIQRAGEKFRLHEGDPAFRREILLAHRNRTQDWARLYFEIVFATDPAADLAPHARLLTVRDLDLRREPPLTAAFAG